MCIVDDLSCSAMAFEPPHGELWHHNHTQRQNVRFLPHFISLATDSP
jgi:hypothetical protein